MFQKIEKKFFFWKSTHPLLYLIFFLFPKIFFDLNFSTILIFDWNLNFFNFLNFLQPLITRIPVEKPVLKRHMSCSHVLVAPGFSIILSHRLAWIELFFGKEGSTEWKRKKETIWIFKNFWNREKIEISSETCFIYNFHLKFFFSYIFFQEDSYGLDYRSISLWKFQKKIF